MATRAQLITRIQDYLNRPNMPSAAVSGWLSSVEGQLNRLLRDHPRMQARATITQDALDPLLPLPDDILGLVVVRRGNIILTQLSAANVDLASRSTDVFIARGDVLELFPPPALETDYDLDYVAALTPLEDDLDTNWVSVYFPDVYLYGALKEAAVYLKEDERLQGWIAEWNARVAELQAEGWNQNVASAPMVTPSSGNLTPTSPR